MDATEKACKDIMMLLLAIAPNGVQLTSGSWRPGSIPHIRKMAEELQQVVGWHHLTQLATEAMARRVPSATGAARHGASQRPPALVLVPGETDADREAHCIAALQTLQPGRVY